MDIPYNTTLSKDERKTFSQRLITLHTLLGQEQEIEYRHELWTHRDAKPGLIARLFKRHTCGTAGCAVGHAMLRSDLFPGLLFEDNRSLYRAFGLDEAGAIQPYQPTQATFDYFGPRSLRYIFGPEAYGKPPTEVTKQDAMDRIEQYITQHLGCQLIEA